MDPNVMESYEFIKKSYPVRDILIPATPYRSRNYTKDEVQHPSGEYPEFYPSDEVETMLDFAFRIVSVFRLAYYDEEEDNTIRLARNSYAIDAAWGIRIFDLTDVHGLATQLYPSRPVIPEPFESDLKKWL